MFPLQSLVGVLTSPPVVGTPNAAIDGQDVTVTTSVNSVSIPTVTVSLAGDTTYGPTSSTISGSSPNFTSTLTFVGVDPGDYTAICVATNGDGSHSGTSSGFSIDSIEGGGGVTDAYFDSITESLSTNFTISTSQVAFNTVVTEPLTINHTTSITLTTSTNLTEPLVSVCTISQHGNLSNSLNASVTADCTVLATCISTTDIAESITSGLALYNQITYPNLLNESLTSSAAFTPVTQFNPILNDALTALDFKTITGSFSVSVNDSLTVTDIVHSATSPLDFDLIIQLPSAEFQQSTTFVGNDSISPSISAVYENDFTIAFAFSISESLAAQYSVQTTDAELNLTIVEQLANVNDMVLDNFSSQFEVYIIEQAQPVFECIAEATPVYPIREDLFAQYSLQTTVVHTVHVVEGPLRLMCDVVPHMINHIIVDVNSPAADFIDWGFVQADINKDQEPDHLGGSLIEAKKQKARLIPHA